MNPHHANALVESALQLEPPLLVIIAATLQDEAALLGTLRSAAKNDTGISTTMAVYWPEALPPALRSEIDQIILPANITVSITQNAKCRALASLIVNALKAFPGHDIALIQPGVQLPLAWDLRLQKAIYHQDNIASAIPMCDVAPMFELIPASDTALLSRQSENVDRAAFCLGDRAYYEIPRIHGLCVYWRGAALQRVLPALDLSAIGTRLVLDNITRQLKRDGWCAVICDYLYVNNPKPADDTTDWTLPNDPVVDSAYRINHPLAGLRRAVGEHLKVQRTLPYAGLAINPVRLHITHAWGGGLEKWVRDFALADANGINLVLSSFRIGDDGGQRLALYAGLTDSAPIRAWDIALPLRSTATSSLEYLRILRQIIEEFCVDAILVSSLINHSLEALTQPVKTVIVGHDFYPVCQAINPQFEGKTCSHCTHDDLKRCQKTNPLNQIFSFQGSNDWHALRDQYVRQLLKHKIEMIVPSPSVAITLKNLDARLAAVPIHIIEHGSEFIGEKLHYRAPGSVEPLRIVVLGRLSLQKGAGLLREASKALSQHAVITLVGCGKIQAQLARDCGWDYIERYEPENLHEILTGLAPHAGLLASVIPETYSYTLSELWALGIPPLATNLGSFSDRIIDGECGFLFEPTANALIKLVEQLHAEPERLIHVAKSLAARIPNRTIPAMVNDYVALFPKTRHALARFPVNIGLQTGLTEPYQQLNIAYKTLHKSYSQLTDSYDEVSQSYTQAQAAYAHANSAFLHANQQLESVWKPWQRAMTDIKNHHRWWTAIKVSQLANGLYEKAQMIELDNQKKDSRDGDGEGES